VSDGAAVVGRRLRQIMRRTVLSVWCDDTGMRYIAVGEKRDKQTEKNGTWSAAADNETTREFG